MWTRIQNLKSSNVIWKRNLKSFRPGWVVEFWQHYYYGLCSNLPSVLLSMLMRIHKHLTFIIEFLLLFQTDKWTQHEHSANRRTIARSRASAYTCPNASLAHDSSRRPAAGGAARGDDSAQNREPSPSGGQWGAAGQSTHCRCRTRTVTYRHWRDELSCGTWGHVARSS